MDMFIYNIELAYKIVVKYGKSYQYQVVHKLNYCVGDNFLDFESKEVFKNMLINILLDYANNIVANRHGELDKITLSQIENQKDYHDKSTYNILKI